MVNDLSLTRSARAQIRELRRDFDWPISTYYPEKAKMRGQPHLIWIVPPTNVNFNNNARRALFAEALKSTAEQYNDVTAYELKQLWDPEDMNLFLKPQNRFTSEGFIRYWDSIDRTLRYAHTVNFKNAKNAFRNTKSVQNKSDQKEREIGQRHPPMKRRHASPNKHEREPRRRSGGNFNQGKIAWKNTQMSKLPPPPPMKRSRHY